MPNIPDVVGQSQSDAEATLRGAGLAVGTVTKAANPTVPNDHVSATLPAAGTAVDMASRVDLNVSSRPVQAAGSGAAQIGVPDVVGLTRTAAEAAFKKAGLALGPVKTQRSDDVPAGGIESTKPGPGTLVSPGAPIELIVSSGPRTPWGQYLPTALFAVLGIAVIWLIAYIVTQEKQVFLRTLADKEIARGLITFLIAITTVGIAIILAISTLVLTEGPEGDKRFDRGKQVLSVLIGVLGTIVGFYFGAADSNTAKQRTQTEQHIVTASLPTGEANKPYPLTTLQTTGLTPPLKWTVTPGLPPGLQLDATSGTISGTPTSNPSKNKFSFGVTDNSVPPLSSTVTLDLEVK
jgi:hypothetical protein